MSVEQQCYTDCKPLQTAHLKNWKLGRYAKQIRRIVKLEIDLMLLLCLSGKIQISCSFFAILSLFQWFSKFLGQNYLRIIKMHWFGAFQHTFISEFSKVLYYANLILELEWQRSQSMYHTLSALFRVSWKSTIITYTCVNSKYLFLKKSKKNY